MQRRKKDKTKEHWEYAREKTTTTRQKEQWEYAKKKKDKTEEHWEHAKKKKDKTEEHCEYAKKKNEREKAVGVGRRSREVTVKREVKMAICLC